MKLRQAKKIGKAFYEGAWIHARGDGNVASFRYSEQQARRALVVLERAIARKIGMKRTTLEAFIRDVAGADTVADYLRAAVYAGLPT